MSICLFLYHCINCGNRSFQREKCHLTFTSKVVSIIFCILFHHSIIHLIFFQLVYTHIKNLYHQLMKQSFFLPWIPLFLLVSPFIFSLALTPIIQTIFLRIMVIFTQGPASKILQYITLWGPHKSVSSLLWLPFCDFSFSYAFIQYFIIVSATIWRHITFTNLVENPLFWKNVQHPAHHLFPSEYFGISIPGIFQCPFPLDITRDYQNNNNRTNKKQKSRFAAQASLWNSSSTSLCTFWLLVNIIY